MPSDTHRLHIARQKTDIALTPTDIRMIDDIITQLVHDYYTRQRPRNPQLTATITARRTLSVLLKACRTRTYHYTTTNGGKASIKTLLYLQRRCRSIPAEGAWLQVQAPSLRYALACVSTRMLKPSPLPCCRGLRCFLLFRTDCSCTS